MAERIDLGKASLVPRGQHFLDVEYKRLQWVTDQGNSYVYLNPAPSTGVPLNSTEHWMLFARRGAKIISGTFVNDVFTFVLDDESTFDITVAGVTAATQDAVEAASLANEKADLANEKALLADEKATLANQAAVDVTQAIQSTETATLSALEAQDANANWTKDATNPLSYFPAPSAPLYFRGEGTFTQAGSGDPSPTNIRPITPFMAAGEQIKLANSGKNLWDEQWELGGYNLSTGAKDTGTSKIRSKNYILCKPSTVYRFLPQTASNDTQPLFYRIDKSFISYGSWSGTTPVQTTPADCYYMTFHAANSYGTVYKNDLAITLGSAPTPYEPYVGSTATLTAPEEIAAGWINNRGEGQATWARKVFDGTEAWDLPTDTRPNAGGYSTYRLLSGTIQVVNAAFRCSHMPVIPSTIYSTGPYKNRALSYPDTLQLMIQIENTIADSLNQTSVTAFKAYLAAQYAAGTPVTVVYPLATPTALTLVSAPINSIPALDLAMERQNVFISSLSGVLTYPKNKVRQDRILNNAQLWRKTSSGNPVSAYPAPESPLYPKVSGTFTQAGTGDPSPENIRPITPWLASGAQVKVTRTGKNLFSKSAITQGQRLSSDGGNITASTYSISDYIRVTPNTGYYLSHVAGSSVGYSVAAYNQNKSFLRIIPVSGSYDTSGAINTGENAYYVRFSIYTETVSIDIVQMELGSTATPYEPYSGQEITLTAPQEIPAGWMDNEGNGQVTWAKVVYNGTEAWTLHMPGTYFAPAVSAGLDSSVGKYCSHAVPTTTQGHQIRFYFTSIPPTNPLFNTSVAEHQTLNDWKAYLAAQYAAGTPVTMAYQLATPKVITPVIAPLTATPQLDRITPRQNVLTASTGNIELTYAKSPTRESDEIRAAIIAHGGTL